MYCDETAWLTVNILDALAVLVCQSYETGPASTFTHFFFFFNDAATTEIYTRSIVGSVRCVQETVFIVDEASYETGLFDATTRRGGKLGLLRLSGQNADILLEESGSKRNSKHLEYALQYILDKTQRFFLLDLRDDTC
eukprot:TRINITY_DN37075_c0_g1_i1.p2 TRINITY_DN37075_c0_g1~~TRINITY_DN37075_c0_g1_i1.p2  ORF type:complete len:138 (+),score=21.81 TRINITY_DN37075_c0_g1_i1:2-415(+)